jgi:hypothetical protein
MRDVFFRSFLIHLSILAVSLVSFSCSENIASSRSVKMGNSRDMKFKFEDYDIKSPEVPQAKLAKLFPEGSSLSEFQKAMEQLGAECHISDVLREKKGNDLMYCRYRAGNSPFVKSQWTVTVDIKDASKISGLKVTAGFVGT